MDLIDLPNNVAANVVSALLILTLTFAWRLFSRRKNLKTRVIMTLIMAVLVLIILFAVWRETGLIVTAIVVTAGGLLLFSFRGSFLWIGWNEPSSRYLQQFKSTLRKHSAYVRQPLAFVAEYHTAHVLAPDQVGLKGCTMEIDAYIRLLEMGVMSSQTEDVTIINTVSPKEWGNSKLADLATMGDGIKWPDNVAPDIGLSPPQLDAWNYFLKQARMKKDRPKLRIRRVIVMERGEYEEMITLGEDGKPKEYWSNFKECHELAKIDLSYLDKANLSVKDRDKVRETAFFWESNGKSGWQLTGTIDIESWQALDVFITADDEALRNRCSSYLRSVLASSKQITSHSIRELNDPTPEFKQAINLIV
jgi:hypothetical protein